MTSSRPPSRISSLFLDPDEIDFSEVGTLGTDGRSSQQQITLTISVGPHDQRATLRTRFVRAGREHVRTLASRRLPYPMPLDTVGDCMDVLARGLSLLMDHPSVTWVEDPSAPPEGATGGLQAVSGLRSPPSPDTRSEQG